MQRTPFATLGLRDCQRAICASSYAQPRRNVVNHCIASSNPTRSNAPQSSRLAAPSPPISSSRTAPILANSSSARSLSSARALGSADIHPGSLSCNGSKNTSQKLRRAISTRPYSGWEPRSTPQLYELLHDLARQGKTGQTTALVDYLVRHREETPNTRLYAALILCNLDPEWGSITNVKDLLAELETEGIPMDSAICHNVLKVLSIHADHLLRADVLNHMRVSWFALSIEGQYDVAAGLLREGCIESAQEMLNNLRRQGEDIPPWLGDLSVYSLLHAGEIASALDTALDRATGGSVGSTQLVHETLDTASRLHHYAGTLHVWNTQVQPGRANPPTGTYLQVLATAAQHGDSDLAIQAFRRLGQQAVVFTSREYELLCEAYLSNQGPELAGALSTASIMVENGISPNQAFTRPFYTLFRDDPRQAQQAFKLMQELHRKGRTVPLGLINTLLESHAVRQDVEQAVNLYQFMHEFERCGPADEPRVPFADSRTFEILYQLAKFAGRDSNDMVTFLRDEQHALGIPTNEVMLNHLLHGCVNSGGVNSATALLHEAHSSGLKPRLGALHRVVELLARARDDSCWETIRRFSSGEEQSRSWEEDARRMWAEG